MVDLYFFFPFFLAPPPRFCAFPTKPSFLFIEAFDESPKEHKHCQQELPTTACLADPSLPS